ncbi:uncharacterized protein [Montipora capricornis]|uniref:uncharacterized protein n=1 Tax=Montipora capricornis TaxID=246305 RepID=UPI0035F20977
MSAITLFKRWAIARRTICPVYRFVSIKVHLNLGVLISELQWTDKTCHGMVALRWKERETLFACSGRLLWHAPKLSVKPLKERDLRAVSKSWESADLPIDILLLSGEDCGLSSCFSFLGQPFKSYNIEVGWIYFEYIGNTSNQEQLKVALKRCSKGSEVPGGSSTAVKNAVRVLKPKAVFLVGTCSGLSSDKVKLGDVVVSAKLTTLAGFKIPVSRHLGDLVRDAPIGWGAPLENPDELEVKVHCDGDILSQAEWCKVADLQKQHPEAIAVETEGEGVFAAAYDEKVEWVAVKGVASFVNQTQPSSSEWMSFASTMAASVVAKMLCPDVFKDWPHCNQGTSNENFELANAQKRQLNESQHEDESQLQEFIQRLKHIVISSTEHVTDLQQPFRPNPGEGPPTKDLTVDEIFINVVIREGRVRYNFPTDRWKQLELYPMARAE